MFIQNAKMIEKKPYNEDSTPKEVALIKQRVSLMEDRIIRVLEMPIITSFSLNTIFDEMQRLAEGKETIGLLVDLRDSLPPGAEARRTINLRFKAFNDKFVHVSYITGKNFLINTAIRFVMYGTGINSFSVDKLEDTALKKMYDALQSK